MASANTAFTAFSMAVWYCSTPRSEVTTLEAPMTAKLPFQLSASSSLDVDFDAEHVAHGVAKLRSRQAAQHAGRRLERRRVRNDRAGTARDARAAEDPAAPAPPP